MKNIKKYMALLLIMVIIIQLIAPSVVWASEADPVVTVEGVGEMNVSDLPTLDPGKYEVTIHHRDFGVSKTITINIFDNDTNPGGDDSPYYHLKFERGSVSLGQNELKNTKTLASLFKDQLNITILNLDEIISRSLASPYSSFSSISWANLIENNNVSMKINGDTEEIEEANILGEIKSFSLGSENTIDEIIIRDGRGQIIGSTGSRLKVKIIDDTPVVRPPEEGDKDKPTTPGGGGGGSNSDGSDDKDKPTTPDEDPKELDKPTTPEVKPTDPKQPVDPKQPTTPEEKKDVEDYKNGDRSKRDDLIGMIIEEQIEYELNKVDHLAYLKGYNDNTIRPEGNLTREEAAMVFYRLMEPEFRLEVDTKDHDFKDVEKGRWSEHAIATLANAGMLSGYKDGTFKPTKQITRAEVSSMIARLTDTVILPTDFNDTIGSWAEDYINSVRRQGWIQGYEDGTFKPNNLIKRSEFTTITNSLLDRKVLRENILPGIKKFKDLKEDRWYYEIMVEAVNGHKYEIIDDIEIWRELDKREFE